MNYSKPYENIKVKKGWDVVDNNMNETTLPF
jgi:hypothetical protein